MNCREHRRNLVEFARGGPLDSQDRQALVAHLESCAECAEALEQQAVLTSAMRELAAETAAAMPPVDIEATLLTQAGSARRHRPLRRALRWVPAMAGALAAAVLAGWFFTGPHRPAKSPDKAARPVSAQQPPVKEPLVPVVQADARASAPARMRTLRRTRLPARPATTAQPEEESAPFIAIPYTEPLAPYERASIVRMDLPVTAVAAAGLPVRVADPFASARADVLVGQDGRVHAIRLLRISTLNPNRRTKP